MQDIYERRDWHLGLTRKVKIKEKSCEKILEASRKDKDKQQ
jgi:hypothetical protein